MQSSAVWLVLVLAIIGANLPFFSNRFFLIFPLKRDKGWIMRVGELIVLYFIVGGLSLALESRLGQIYPQKWEFYAVSASMFIVLAFPGYVARYLTRRITD
ncbi:hypothetical protein GALL_180520 [mine drainage metagenome]|uniref:DUF2818 family protein n=1 Tax=mine drainage metagenome TaxID=410659 RepID=A0A1J5RV45_9ZZZZ